jgi:DNA-directed RNA polymerase specialized sigma subunit
MSELKDIFGKRKHPNIYSDKIIPTENDIRDKVVLEQRLELVNSIMNDLHFYDKTLFKVYYETDHSIRSLAEATGISTTSIFYTIKNVRNYIKNEIKGK